MEAVIAAAIKGLLSSSSLKLILTLIAVLFGYKITKMAAEREKRKAAEDTSKKRSQDQANIDVPNSNLESDFQKSQDEVRDILGDGK